MNPTSIVESADAQGGLARPERAPAGPPRVRVEWLTAGTRIVLAFGAFVAVAVDPAERSRYFFFLYLIGWYLAYSIGMVALVWRPLKFARGWDVAVHLFDLVAFAIMTVVTSRSTSPFYANFLFLLVCGMLRWQVRGTLWTAAAALGVYAATTFWGVYALDLPQLELQTFVIRCVYLAIITVLVVYVGVHQLRFQQELGRMAAWPRRTSGHRRDIVGEVLHQAQSRLGGHAVVLVWKEPGQHGTNVAWYRNGHAQWIVESEEVYDPLVIPTLKHAAFQAADVSRRGRVTQVTAEGFRRRDCVPIHERLQQRFDMRAVQSWPLEGELINGRLFSLNKRRMRLDDLPMGDLVAQLVLATLENLHMLGCLREAAALETRVRVARDLHDSLLQSQAGAAIQLLTARRLLDRDLDAARNRLQDVQAQLENGELEMRSFIRDLRPMQSGTNPFADVNLTRRLDDLRNRVERQWDVNVQIAIDGDLETVPEALRDDVYRLVQEATVNAARHAGASLIQVSIDVTGVRLRLDVVDDGRGFPFHGTYDLARLNEMNEGPWTLKERVAELAGELTLNSMDTGTALRMTLPLGQVN